MSYLEPTGWIQTYSGKKFFPLNPKLEDINIEDIAHALSMMCRFTGHCKSFYSVAQHCVLVSMNCSDQNKLYGLLHDASEAYITDVARPIKRTKEMEGYRVIEYRLQSAICEKFGLPKEEPEEVKIADTRMLVTEARDLMSPLHPEWKNYAEPYDFKIDALLPHMAKKLFLDRFNELTRK